MPGSLNEAPYVNHTYNLACNLIRPQGLDKPGRHGAVSAACLSCPKLKPPAEA